MGDKVYVHNFGLGSHECLAVVEDTLNNKPAGIPLKCINHRTSMSHLREECSDSLFLCGWSFRVFGVSMCNYMIFPVCTKECP